MTEYLSGKSTADDYITVNEALAAMSVHRRHEADVLIAQAMAYVWGWMDAGRQMPIMPGSTGVAWAFAWHFGTLVITGGSRPSIHQAWDAWRIRFPQAAPRTRAVTSASKINTVRCAKCDQTWPSVAASMGHEHFA